MIIIKYKSGINTIMYNSCIPIAFIHIPHTLKKVVKPNKVIIIKCMATKVSAHVSRNGHVTY